MEIDEPSRPTVHCELAGCKKRASKTPHYLAVQGIIHGISRYSQPAIAQQAELFCDRGLSMPRPYGLAQILLIQGSDVICGVNGPAFSKTRNFKICTMCHNPPPRLGFK